MTNQPNKATVKDGLPTAEQILHKHFLCDPNNQPLDEVYVGETTAIYSAMQSYSDQQNAELLAWKESAMRELNELDLQSLGRKLGIGLGQSVSENVHSKVDELMERVRELEGENFNLAAHQCDNWKPEENGDWSCSLQSQLAKYREALEKIANSHSESPGEDGLIEIAIGALK